MPTSVRCYLPLSLSELAATWPQLEPGTAFAPADPHELHGDARDEAEWAAFAVAAAAAIDAALADGAARVVLAADVPAVTMADQEVYPGVVALAQQAVPSTAVVSAHVDEPATVTAVRACLEHSREQAETTLAEADLLWFDATEIPGLIDSANR